MTTYIADIAHYNEVLARVASVRHSLVIGTAGIVGEAVRCRPRAVLCTAEELEQKFTEWQK